MAGSSFGIWIDVSPVSGDELLKLICDMFEGCLL